MQSLALLSQLLCSFLLILLLWQRTAGLVIGIRFQDGHLVYVPITQVNLFAFGPVSQPVLPVIHQRYVILQGHGSIVIFIRDVLYGRMHRRGAHHRRHPRRTLTTYVNG